MRLVLDTNIVVSALVWGGTPYKLLQAATEGDIELFTSPALLAELRGWLRADALIAHHTAQVGARERRATLRSAAEGRCVCAA